QLHNKQAFKRSYMRSIAPVSFMIGVRIGLATGMRLGEVLGLCWGNVDLANKKIKVAQSLLATGEIDKPKSKASIRTISIDTDTVEHLKNWKQRQFIELSKFGVKQTDSTPVVCSSTGGYFGVNNYERSWRQFRAKSGYPKLKFHELRHTQATLWIANGVDIKTVQTRLGHADPSITMKWYAHAVPENDENGADMWGKLLNADTQKTVNIIEVKTA
ncbi:MAG: site-specific integrase, partial [Eggerthellaceae bacterium]|nr:site-specific integrase [Eggerthellaceae bacterium]